MRELFLPVKAVRETFPKVKWATGNFDFMVKVEVRSGILTVTATNGHNLARAQIEVQAHDGVLYLKESQYLNALNQTQIEAENMRITGDWYPGIRPDVDDLIPRNIPDKEWEPLFEGKLAGDEAQEVKKTMVVSVSPKAKEKNIWIPVSALWDFLNSISDDETNLSEVKVFVRGGKDPVVLRHENLITLIMPTIRKPRKKKV